MSTSTAVSRSGPGDGPVLRPRPGDDRFPSHVRPDPPGDRGQGVQQRHRPFASRQTHD